MNVKWFRIGLFLTIFTIFTIFFSFFDKKRVKKVDFIVPQGFLGLPEKEVEEKWSKLVNSVNFTDFPQNSWIFSLSKHEKFKLLTRFSSDDYWTLSRRISIFWYILEEWNGIDSSLQQYLTIFKRLIFSFLDSNLDLKWLKMRRFELKGRGLVYTIGPRHVKFALFSMLNARKLGCTLPIEVHHDGDLSEDDMKRLSQVDNVSFIDSRRFFSMNDVRYTMDQGDGWSAKARAVLASNFKEIMIVDSDIVWFQDPSILFDGQEYKETGTLFFYDRRSLLQKSKVQQDWLGGFLNLNSDTLEINDNLMRFGKNYYEMESGVILIDVQRHFPQVLTVVRLNTGDVSRKVYGMSYGDKETWWIGWEMTNGTYRMNNLPAGGMGTSWKFISKGYETLFASTPWEWINLAKWHPWSKPLHKNGDLYRVCGCQLIHVWYLNGKILPFWANSGPTQDKTNPLANFMNPDSWLLERDGKVNSHGATFVENGFTLDEPLSVCMEVDKHVVDEVGRIHWIEEDVGLESVVRMLKGLWESL